MIRAGERRTASLRVDLRLELGEGPVWDAAAGCLYCVDILQGRVHRYDPVANASRVYDVGRMVGAAAPTRRGDLVLAVHDGFARLDPSSGVVTRIARIDPHQPDLRMNDGKCDPAGRFWAGTMALDERPRAGALYRLDPDGAVHTMLRDVTISNGLDWSDDGRTMYFIDSPTQTVDAFDFDVATGSIANRRTVVRIPIEHGTPDGLALDSDGGVWVSLWGGGAVHRYTATGTLDAIVHVPTPFPTSCTFGGDDLGDLYITTAWIQLAADERAGQPHAGSLFHVRSGARGRPANRFGG